MVFRSAESIPNLVEASPLVLVLVAAAAILVWTSELVSCKRVLHGSLSIQWQVPFSCG